MLLLFLVMGKTYLCIGCDHNHHLAHFKGKLRVATEEHIIYFTITHDIQENEQKYICGKKLQQFITAQAQVLYLLPNSSLYSLYYTIQ